MAPEIFPSPLLHPDFITPVFKDVEIVNRVGRIEGGLPDIGLFIKIGQPECSGESIAQLIFAEIADEATSMTKLTSWISSWDMVRVLANSDISNSVELSPVKAIRNVIPLKTRSNELIIPALHADHDLTGKFTLAINHHPTTEGAIVAISHLIGESILRQTLNTHPNPTPLNFLETALEISKLPLQVLSASETDMASLLLRFPEHTHGRILGHQASFAKRFLGCAIITPPKPTSVCLAETSESILHVVSISGGKRLHLGHALLIQTAQERALKEGGQVIIRNNNTGTRVNEFILELAHNKELSFAQAAILSQGLSVAELEAVWQNRQKSNDIEPNILPLDVFAPITQSNIQVVSQVWGNAPFLNEHFVIANSGLEPLIHHPGINPQLSRAGMTILDGTVLIENGSPTAHGSDALICWWLIHNFGAEIDFVDSSVTTKRSVEAARKLISPHIRQSLGLGMIIGHEPASGSNGNCPTLQEISDQISPQKTHTALHNIITSDWLLKNPLSGQIDWWVRDSQTAVSLMHQFSHALTSDNISKNMTIDSTNNKDLTRLIGAAVSASDKPTSDKSIRKIEAALTHNLNWFPQDLADFLNSHGFTESVTENGFTITKLISEAHETALKILRGELQLVRNPFNL